MEEIKKILLLRHKLTVYGGAELVFLEEVKNLKARGFDICVVAVEISEDFSLRLKALKVEPISIKGGGLLLESIRLRRKINKFNPDFIVAHENGHIHLFFASLLMPRKVKTILHLYGTYIWLLGSRLNKSIIFRKKIEEAYKTVASHIYFQSDYKKKCGFIERIKIETQALLDFFSIRKFDKVLTCARTTAKEIDILYGINAYILAGGVDTNYFSPQDKKMSLMNLGFSVSDRLIITINRLDPRKRIDLLIKSFAKVHLKFPNSKLVIIGTGPELENLKDVAGKTGHSSNIIFAGFVEEDNLKKYYAASDVVAYPAWCAWGLVPLEALAMNVKVAISTDAMIQEALKEVDGVFISKPEVDLLSDILCKALETGAIDARKVINEKFSWGTYFDEMVKVCKEMMR
jgi:glycosyltransferase involved in cell wall biosynthesis